MKRTAKSGVGTDDHLVRVNPFPWIIVISQLQPCWHKPHSLVASITAYTAFRAHMVVASDSLMLLTENKKQTGLCCNY